MEPKTYVKMLSLYPPILVKHIISFIVIFLYFNLAFSQESELDNKIHKAFELIERGKYKKVIPILKNYYNNNGIDDFTNLKINVFLNWCYLNTDKSQIDEKQLNSFSESYINKYGISISDSSKTMELINIFYFLGNIYGVLENYDKVIFYFSNIEKIYTNNNIKKGDAYFEALTYIVLGYNSLKDYNNAIKLAQKYYDLNLELTGQYNEFSLRFLDIISDSYLELNDSENAIKQIEKWIEIKNFRESNEIDLDKLQDRGIRLNSYI